MADLRKALDLLADSPKGLVAGEVANELLKDPRSPAAPAEERAAIDALRRELGYA